MIALAEHNPHTGNVSTTSANPAGLRKTLARGERQRYARTGNDSLAAGQARTVPLPEHVGPDRQPAHEIDECDHERHSLIPAITARRSERSDGGENDQCQQPGCAPPGCVARLPPGRPARQLGAGQAGGDACGDRGQVRVGTRCERLADPFAELVLGQPSCTNAALSVSIICSRSACDARSWPQPTRAAAFSLPGPAITAPPLGGGSQDSVARLRPGGQIASGCSRYSSKTPGAIRRDRC